MKKIILLFFSLLFSAAACAGKPQGLSGDGGKKWAIVNASNIFLRAEARYGSECVSQSRMGTLVEVLEARGYWVKVRTPEPYEGWVNELALAPVEALPAEKQAKMKEYSPKLKPFGDDQAAEWLSSDRYICIVENATAFCEASDKAERLSDLLMSDILGAGKQSAPEGWRSVRLPDGREGYVRSACLEPFREWAEDVCWHRINSGEDISADIVALAKRFLGMPYLWGGMSVGHFDCSGLAGFCYFMHGILLPRDASQQVKCGIEVPVGRMRPGDLVFFGDKGVSHVAICIGPKRIIHASQVVRINSLDPAAPDYYGRNILAVRRILGHLGEGSEGFAPFLIVESPSYFAK